MTRLHYGKRFDGYRRQITMNNGVWTTKSCTVKWTHISRGEKCQLQIGFVRSNALAKFTADNGDVGIALVILEIHKLDLCAHMKPK